MIRVPAEWETQSASLIAWPDINGDFGSDFEAVEQSYQCLAKAINDHQALFIICKNSDHQESIEQQLAKLNNIRYLHADYDDIWIRDSTAISIDNAGRTQAINFKFNGWGKKHPYQQDNQLSQQLQTQGFFNNCPLLSTDVVLEGGNIDSDGQGRVLSNRLCLHHLTRNATLAQTDIEQTLEQQLGIKYWLWLNQNPLEGDDTDGHTDTLARFCTPDHIVYTCCNDPNDSHYQSLQNLRKQIQQFRTCTGKPYQLTELPLPQPKYDHTGRRLAANYTNFVIINNAVLVPSYNDPMDDIIKHRLSHCFPGRKIIAIPALPLIKQNGSLHCMTMHFFHQLPYDARKN